MPRWPKGSTGNVKRAVAVPDATAALVDAALASVKVDGVAADDYAFSKGDGPTAIDEQRVYVAIHEDGTVTPRRLVDRETLLADYPLRTVDTDADTETETPMKILFDSVELHSEVPRLDAAKGLAAHTTAFFDISQSKGIVLEYDTHTCFLRISCGFIATYVPREGVKRFGPTLEDVVAMKADARRRADAAAEANARAAVEAEAIANMPA